MTDIKEQISVIIECRCGGCKWYIDGGCKASDEYLDENDYCWEEK